MYRLLSGIFMGWSLGSNDSANIFGTAVSTGMVRYRTAVLLSAILIMAGSLLSGAAGMHTLSGLVRQTADSAFVTTLAAALAVTLMTVLKLPVSTSQAVVGAIIGIGLMNGQSDFSGLRKVVLCWVGTPLGTMLVSVLLYLLLGKFLEMLPLHIFARDRVLRWGLLLAGGYGAYALGANNVANVTGVYIETGRLTVLQAALVGGGSIALGVLTYSRNVMYTVGHKLVRLDPFSAFIAVLSSAIVVHIYALVGVPVSSSQAIIGAVLGIGILKGVRTISFRTMLSIFSGWLASPIAAGFIAYTLFGLLY